MHGRRFSLCFFWHNIFSDSLGILHPTPWSHLLSRSFMSVPPPHPHVSFPTKDLKNSPIWVIYLLNGAWSNSAACPLNRTESFLPFLHPWQKPSIVGSYSLASPSHVLRVPLGGFPSRLLPFLGCMGALGEGSGCQGILPCPFLSTVYLPSLMSQQKLPPCSSQSAGIWIMGLRVVSGESTDHKHGLWFQ